MTIRQADDIVRGLIGEDDYRHMKKDLARLYDIAQRQIATTAAPIRRSFIAECGRLCRLPSDLYRLAGSDAGYRRVDDDHIILSGSGSAAVRYLAYPAQIDGNTDDDTEFEVRAEAQSAIPYFAAAYSVLSDSDMRRYYAFIDTYNNILSNIVAADRDMAAMTVVTAKEIQ